ncbi:hypothetical protein HDU96_002987 [Phlyctochytrium bullatum]|nr:hypothetical protein HDU96_002987 [Phlyctochytrium bullatum]
MPSPRSLAASLLTTLLLALALPPTLAKQCIYHYDTTRKSILVWDAYLPAANTNPCTYWTWHYINLSVYFAMAQPYISHVCSRPNINEVGFLLTSPLNSAPDHLFDRDVVCNLYTHQHVFQHITANGWTCVYVPELVKRCGEQGTPIAIPTLPGSTLV